MMRPIRLFFILTLVLIADIFLFWEYRQSGVTEVTFLDVGQGDSILIESSDGNRLLIDSGKEGSIGRPLSRATPFLANTIDVFLLTHSDADHVGGAVEVLSKYKVKTLILSGPYNGENDQLIIDIAREKGVEIKQAYRGQIIEMGDGGYAQILFPDRAAQDFETNFASIGLKYTYGNSDFLLTGDMPSSVEEYLVNLDKNYLKSEVLKLGHHGSKTSTSESFLKTVSPEYVVISAGKNNSYGHPHKEVLDRIKELKVVSTFRDGNITFVTDGSSIELK